MKRLIIISLLALLFLGTWAYGQYCEVMDLQTRSTAADPNDPNGVDDPNEIDDPNEVEDPNEVDPGE